MGAAGAGGTRVVGPTPAVGPVPPLCILIHPSSPVQICGSLQCPGMLDEEPLLGHGCFTCRLKGSEKGRSLMLP